MEKLTGKEFNEKYTMELYKEVYNNTLYNFNNVAKDGYISFTKKEDIKFTNGYAGPCLYIRKISILDDSVVLIDKNEKEETFRTNKAILHEIENVWENEDLCKLAINKKPYCIKYVKNQNYDLWKLAIKYDGDLLKHINEQTPELCELAIKQNSMALAFVINQTYELCEMALKENGLALAHVKDQTPELCELAVCQNGLALMYVKKDFKTLELCELAIKYDGNLLKHVDEQTYELCEVALKNNGMALYHVKNQTPELCELAVYQNGLALMHVKKDFKTLELCELAILQNEDAAQHVTPELVIKYINQIKKLQATITKLTPVNVATKPREMLTINKVTSGRNTGNYLIVHYDDVFNCVNPKSQFFLEKSEFMSDIATFDMLEEIFHQHEFTNNNTKQSKYDFTYNINFTDKLCTLVLEIPRASPLSPIREAHQFTCH